MQITVWSSWVVEAGKNTAGRVRHGFEKLLVGFLAAGVKKWNLDIA